MALVLAGIAAGSVAGRWPMRFDESRRRLHDDPLYQLLYVIENNLTGRRILTLTYEEDGSQRYETEIGADGAWKANTLPTFKAKIIYAMHYTGILQVHADAGAGYLRMYGFNLADDDWSAISPGILKTVFEKWRPAWATAHIIYDQWEGRR